MNERNLRAISRLLKKPQQIIQPHLDRLAARDIRLFRLHDLFASSSRADDLCARSDAPAQRSADILNSQIGFGRPRHTQTYCNLAARPEEFGRSVMITPNRRRTNTGITRGLGRYQAAAIKETRRIGEWLGSKTLRLDPNPAKRMAETTG